MSAVVRGEGLCWTRPPRGDAPAQLVLQDAEIAVQPGEMVAISGPSGIGKSVLGSLLIRLREVPEPGRVYWGDVEVSSLSARRLQPLRAAFQGLLQHTGAILPPFCTVEESLVETLRHVRRVPRREARQRAREVAELLGIGELLHRRPRFLSGGEQRKSGVARLLLSDARFAFVDEPDSGLDPVSQHDIVGELRKVVDRTGMGMLVVTHNAMLARRYADRRLLLGEGRLHAA
jgi:ABC-type glutathione transport system ATPase component